MRNHGRDPTKGSNPLIGDSVIYANLITLFYDKKYSEVPIIRPPKVLVENGHNSEQVSLMRPIYIENCILVLKQVVLMARVVLISNGLNSQTLLYLYIRRYTYL